MNRKYLHNAVGELPRSVEWALKSSAQFVPDRLLHGAEYFEWRSRISDSEWWTSEELREYQNEKLRELVDHAYENVPYYRDVFEDNDLTPDDIRSVDDLEKLPFLTKEDVVENYEALQAENVDDTVAEHTSGSTGEPFKFQFPSHANEIERAFKNRAFRAHGTDLFHEKTVWLRSYSPEEGEPIYKDEPHLNIRYLSPFHLSEERIEEYVRLIDSYGGDTLVGYPSSMYIFSLLLDRTDASVPDIRVVHTGSENLLPEWRDRIESVLGVPVKDHYGMAERVGLFHQCSESDAYHDNPEYGVVELVDNGRGAKEVVGTCLWNYAMPFIRYRMGDTAVEREGSHSCACGRGLPLRVSSFQGREDDILRTPDGRMLPGVNFYTLMYETEPVEMFKIVQESVDSVRVELVVDDRFDKTYEDELRSGLRKRLGTEIDVTLDFVDMIERDEQSGKIRCIESRLE